MDLSVFGLFTVFVFFPQCKVSNVKVMKLLASYACIVRLFAFFISVKCVMC